VTAVAYGSLRAAASVALDWYYAGVIVQGRERVPEQGPLLVVANHPNALVDALIVSTTVRRRVSLTAKATLFEHRVLAPLLHTLGIIPLRRAQDERAAARSGAPSVRRNTDAFRFITKALRDGGAVLVFPEGISHDDPALAPLKTGAARMALEARAEGVRGLRLLPIGLVYEEKERPRSRVLVRVGDPVDVDAWCSGNEAGTEAGDAARLTAEVDARLRQVTLNFASADRAQRAVALARALAAIADAPPSLDHPRPLATEAELAQRIKAAIEALSSAPSALVKQADEFVQRVARLEAELVERGAQLADVRISPRVRHGARFVVREGLLAALALPVALLGHVTHWLPLRLARGLALRSLAGDPSRDQPAMRTIVFGLGLVLVWYLVQTWAVAHFAGPLAAALWLAAIFGAARIDLAFSDRLERAGRRARTYIALRRDESFRSRVLHEIDALLADAIALERALMAQARAPLSPGRT
jgi:glycerol-3-phosphate O-acyltransferase/dihydroxyacetone phosphate acyltransferase